MSATAADYEVRFCHCFISDLPCCSHRLAAVLCCTTTRCQMRIIVHFTQNEMPVSHPASLARELIHPPVTLTRLLAAI